MLEAQSANPAAQQPDRVSYLPTSFDVQPPSASHDNKPGTVIETGFQGKKFSGGKRKIERKPWVLTFDGVGDPNEERRRAVQMTLANGALTHQPWEHLALRRGLFEQLPQRGPDEPSTTPSALLLPDSYSYFLGNTKDIRDLRRKFDPRNRILTTNYEWQDSDGRTAGVETKEFDSQEDPAAVQHIRIQPHFTGEITLGTGITARNLNGDGVFYEKMETAGISGLGVLFAFKTRYKKEEGAIVQRSELRRDGEVTGTEPEFDKDKDQIYQIYKVKVTEGVPITVTAVSTYQSTADPEMIEGRRSGHPVHAALHDRSILKPFELLEREHIKARERLLKPVQVIVAGDDEIQQALDFNHSTVASSLETGNSHAGPGAKEGFKPDVKAYGTRTFWDTDIFDVDSLNPEQLKTYLLYRYNQLPDARKKAEKYTGVKVKPGAFWVWEGARPGYGEGCPERVLDANGRVQPIESLQEEIHISGDVAYFVKDYYRRTGDMEMLKNQGAEMIVEAARFYLNRAEYNQKEDRYELHGVTGPDEYHPGVNNNAFTNGLAKYTVMQALEMSRKGLISDKTRRKLGLDGEEIKKLSNFAEKIYIPFDPKTFTFIAFDGWEKLEKDGHVDLSKFPGKTLMDVVLVDEYMKRTGKKPEELTEGERHQVRMTDVIKQHDTTLLTNMLGMDTLQILPAHMLSEMRKSGLSDKEILQKIREANYRKYGGQICDGSSLSPNKTVEVALEAGTDPDSLYEKYREAVLMDFKSNTHGIEQGLHTAAAGGSEQATKSFGGIRAWDDALTVNPRLPSKWEGLYVRSFYRGKGYEVSIDQAGNSITVELSDPSADCRIPVNIRERQFVLNARNSSVTVPYVEKKPEPIFYKAGVQEQVVYAGI